MYWREASTLGRSSVPEKTGIPFAKAYDDLLQTDETAREFYAYFRAARRDPSTMAERHEQLRKRAEAERADESRGSDAECRLEGLAEDSAWREACRNSGRAADQVRTCHQSQDSEGARPDHSAGDSRGRRRG